MFIVSSKACGVSLEDEYSNFFEPCALIVENVDDFFLSGSPRGYIVTYAPCQLHTRFTDADFRAAFKARNILPRDIEGFHILVTA